MQVLVSYSFYLKKKRKKENHYVLVLSKSKTFPSIQNNSSNNNILEYEDSLIMEYTTKDPEERINH